MARLLLYLKVVFICLLCFLFLKTTFYFDSPMLELERFFIPLNFVKS